MDALYVGLRVMTTEGQGVIVCAPIDFTGRWQVEFGNHRTWYRPEEMRSVGMSPDDVRLTAQLVVDGKVRVKFSMMPIEVTKAQKGAALALRQAGFGKVRTSKGTLWEVPEKLRHWGMTRAAVLARPEEDSDKEKSE